MNKYLTVIDFIIGPLFLVIIYFLAKTRQTKRIEENPSYKYFLLGLFAKIFGGISVCLIYALYYGGGDTLNYYSDTATIVNLFLKSPADVFNFLTGPSPELWYHFDDSTGYPVYFSDTHAIIVVKLTFILCLLSFKSFLGMTILLASISYLPIWRLYQMFIKEFPQLTGQFAIALFFVPSVFFWGSGLLKDTITFSAVCLFASSYSYLITSKKGRLSNIVFLLISSLLLIWIKPYILFALLPGSILWYGGIKLSQVNNNLVKAMTTPFLITFSMIAGYLMLRLMSLFLGDYSLDNVLDKAIVTQQDLKNERYEGASFDIGSYDATVSGVLGKMPIAIVSCLFRPYLWEVYNVTMLLSGIENFIMLFFTIYLLVKLKVYNMFRLMFRHRILFFTVYFSLFFSFSVGLTTSNFGSLVRYKIPGIPFFVISLMIIANTFSELKKEREDSLLAKVI